MAQGDPTAEGQRLPSVAEMMSQLQARLAKNPDDAQGWFLLARGHLSQGNYTAAVDAFKRVIEISGETAPVLVRYADALAMASGGSLQGRPMELIQRALELEPRHPQALWLAGIAAADGGDDKQALVYWEWARDALTSESDRAELDQQIAEVRARLGQAPAPAATSETTIEPTTPAAASGSGVRLRVRLDPTIAAQARPEQTVFIFARAPQGPPMPLAAVRRTVAELPLTVTLDDRQAMTPALRISGFQAVRLVARVSSSGQPTASPGDLFGEIPMAAVGGTEVLDLVINQVTPGSR
jgi:cytochrome c-type biogenesis protein CcmH